MRFSVLFFLAMMTVFSLNTDIASAASETFEIEQLLEAKFCRKKRIWIVKVRWEGYGEDADTWEPLDDMINALQDGATDHLELDDLERFFADGAVTTDVRHELIRLERPIPTPEPWVRSRRRPAPNPPVIVPALRLNLPRFDPRPVEMQPQRIHFLWIALSGTRLNQIPLEFVLPVPQNSSVGRASSLVSSSHSCNCASHTTTSHSLR